MSIPRQVATIIAERLSSKGISLIAGVEYKISDPSNKNSREIEGYANNQLIYLLCLSNGQMIQVVQEKTIPAIHEEKDLFALGGLVLKASNHTKYIIQHGKFIFSGFICNDLLNIDNRQPLRGKIDALIVVEWNPDITTYDSMIKATSNDLHCFVIQVNNRQYGDTRLRGPYKDEWQRDKVSVRGGELDYFVVATLEIDKLRNFQMHYRSPEKPFKPVPTGFIISDERKTETFKPE